jgi:hypothetical protein
VRGHSGRSLLSRCGGRSSDCKCSPHHLQQFARVPHLLVEHVRPSDRTGLQCRASSWSRRVLPKLRQCHGGPEFLREHSDPHPVRRSPSRPARLL